MASGNFDDGGGLDRFPLCEHFRFSEISGAQCYLSVPNL